MKILIVGTTGMLGYSLFTNLSEHDGYEVFGTVRNILGKEKFFEEYLDNLIFDIDVNDFSRLKFAIETIKPDVVINCIGLIKQHDISKQHINAIEINSLLPHKIAQVCDGISAKLIHFSTDCVFSGKTGKYIESDIPDATDIYGKSKCLGEVNYGKHLTLRTSIIGHELNTSVSLIDWFLTQNNKVNGFSKAVFSGLPTCYIANILIKYILPNKQLNGLFHLSVDPIDKYSLLKLISKVYGKGIEVIKSEHLVIDRSLDSSYLRNKTGLNTIDWPELINYMYADYLKRYCK
ncbi:SDR family oxidoreductase [Vibrio cholerae]|uniref:dTDP-4-dehydrorhamnose reductase family protein n=1 Tax=Vibrio cholerae TaxID=666 RepID=UPI001DEABEB6|nr:SDR family oxidoreductase [Vibrio cholerae]EJL6590243.1 SDR family oxidoreductase [Vibrio cholerae]EKF9828418.1 SDR family oxidoreductase [Vibrio cholerae]ELJ8468627.1 SDR family oxidoreductase [Vibrio cholerae]HDZ3692457.1 SDR family oxidoreductase [Vibrio cholerae]